MFGRSFCIQVETLAHSFLLKKNHRCVCRFGRSFCIQVETLALSFLLKKKIIDVSAGSAGLLASK